MTTAIQTNGATKKSLLLEMATKYGMEPLKFQDVLLKTVMPSNAQPENVAAFLIVANEYDLNPFTKEIYAFPSKGGGIAPMVSIDGWIKLANKRPEFDNCELIDVFDESNGAFVAVEARIYRKDRSRPLVIREYLAECVRATEPWNRWPRRMLRHKAFIQGVRMAFGFAGIVDEDEYERAIEVEATTAHKPDPSAKLTARMSLANAKVVEPQDRAGGSSIAETLKQSDELFDGAISREEDPA